MREEILTGLWARQAPDDRRRRKRKDSGTGEERTGNEGSSHFLERTWRGDVPTLMGDEKWLVKRRRESRGGKSHR